jgi:hypothetical protein
VAAEGGACREAVVGRERGGGGLGPGAEEEGVVHVRGIERRFTGGGGLRWPVEAGRESGGREALGFGREEEETV